jgi:hypothetical protein
MLHVNRSPSPPVIDLAPDQWTPGEVDEIGYDNGAGGLIILSRMFWAGKALYWIIYGLIALFAPYVIWPQPAPCKPFLTYICDGYNP